MFVLVKVAIFLPVLTSVSFQKQALLGHVEALHEGIKYDCEQCDFSAEVNLSNMFSLFMRGKLIPVNIVNSRQNIIVLFCNM